MEFVSAEFLGSTNEQRAARCRAFAAEANRLGETASGEMRDAYLGLANSWSELASEMESVSWLRRGRSI